MFIRIPVFVKDRPPDKLLHVLFGDDGSDTGRHSDPVYGFRHVDAVDNVITDLLDIVLVIVGGYM